MAEIKNNKDDIRLGTYDKEVTSYLEKLFPDNNLGNPGLEEKVIMNAIESFRDFCTNNENIDYKKFANDLKVFYEKSFESFKSENIAFRLSYAQLLKAIKDLSDLPESQNLGSITPDEKSESSVAAPVLPQASVLPQAPVLPQASVLPQAPVLSQSPGPQAPSRASSRSQSPGPQASVLPQAQSPLSQSPEPQAPVLSQSPEPQAPSRASSPPQSPGSREPSPASSRSQSPEPQAPSPASPGSQSPGPQSPGSPDPKTLISTQDVKSKGSSMTQSSWRKQAVGSDFNSLPLHKKEYVAGNGLKKNNGGGRGSGGGNNNGWQI